MKEFIPWIKRHTRQIRWALIALLFCLVFPLLLAQIFILSGFERNIGTLGDYLGGASTWLVQAITVALLVVIWRSERDDDRASTFNEGLLRLIELYVTERDKINKLRPSEKNGYFAYMIGQKASEFGGASSAEARRTAAIQWIDSDYREISAWRLSLFRISMYVRESHVSPELEHAAMKLLRVSCDRYEQQVFFLLLHEREPTSTTAIHFFEHKFFQFAAIVSDPVLKEVWEGRPDPWKTNKKWPNDHQIAEV